MEKNENTFVSVLESVPEQCKSYVEELHNSLLDAGCKVQYKTAASGWMVSYLDKDKHAVANLFFRKAGPMFRVYGEHLEQYVSLFDELPASMEKAIRKAPPCKRLLDPAACNPKCKTGYIFTMKGEDFQKCRYKAFEFLINEESFPSIRDFVSKEAKARME